MQDVSETTHLTTLAAQLLQPLQLIVVLALLPAQAIPATAATLVLVIAATAATAATLVLVMAATAATAVTAVIHHLVVDQLLAQWMQKMVVTPTHPM